ncbi:MAG: DNA mismatch endonuclease Vsr [Clostridiaceae bacterium]|nr:DNA mismatch endonuclease Vsr [Clostridiaceae bacterium]
MADSLSTEKRSWNMSKIRSSDTSIEVKVRKYLFSEGFRYKKNDCSLPGKPDIVLPKYKTVIFVHGCFWHRHKGCKGTTTPKTRTAFWQEKFIRNVANDEKHKNDLIALGWNVIVIWECEINRRFDETMEYVVDELREMKQNF